MNVEIPIGSEKISENVLNIAKFLMVYCMIPLNMNMNETVLSNWHAIYQD